MVVDTEPQVLAKIKAIVASDNSICTMADIAKQLGVSREWIRRVIKDDNDLYMRFSRKGRRAAALQRELTWRRSKYGKNVSKSDFFSDDLRRARMDRLHNKRSNARAIGVAFDLTYGDLYWPTHCPILGIELDYMNTQRSENSPSFDRIDPKKGYVKDNVVVLSWRANRIKNDGTADEHRQIAAYLEALTNDPFRHSC